MTDSSLPGTRRQTSWCHTKSTRTTPSWPLPDSTSTFFRGCTSSLPSHRPWEAARRGGSARQRSHSWLATGSYSDIASAGALFLPGRSASHSCSSRTSPRCLFIFRSTCRTGEWLPQTLVRPSRSPRGSCELPWMSTAPLGWTSSTVDCNSRLYTTCSPESLDTT